MLGQLGHVPISLLPRVDEALDRWRQFLMNEVENPGPFEQHLIPLDLLQSPSVETPANINRYLIRAIDAGTVASNTQAYVYCKLGRMLLIGFVSVRKVSSEWTGTKIRLRRGAIGSNIVIPAHLWNYIESRARSVHAVRLSPRQRDLIDASLEGDLSRLASSEVFRAMQQDVEMFGASAFTDYKE